MKTILLLLSLFLPVLSFCQDILPVDSSSHKVTYTGIVNVANVKSGEIFTLALEWFVKEFKSPSDGIQYQNKETGKIIGNGSFEKNHHTLLNSIPGTMKFILTIEVKDGKYRYTFTDFRWINNQVEIYPEDWVGKNNNSANKNRKVLNDNMANIIISLRNALTKQAGTSDF